MDSGGRIFSVGSKNNGTYNLRKAEISLSLDLLSNFFLGGGRGIVFPICEYSQTSLDSLSKYNISLTVIIYVTKKKQGDLK